MRNALLLLLLLPAFAFCQSPLTKIVVDRFTGDTTVQLNKPILIKKGAGLIIIDIVDSKGFPTLAFHVTDRTFGCTLNSHMVKILFDDNTSYSCYNSVEGCNGVALIVLNNGPAINKQLYYKLQESVVAAVRIENDATFYDFDITSADGKKLNTAAIYILGGKKSCVGTPVDSSAVVPKKAKLPKLSSSNP